MIIGIIAISKNLAIGRGGKLPWHYPADLRFFRETTTGNAVVMGSRTWRSIGKPLPDRLNVVLTRSADISVPPEVMKLESVNEVVVLSRYLNRDIYIIGGAKTYEAFEEIIDRWIVTEVPVTVEDADTFMPANYLDGFKIIETRELSDSLKVKILQRT